MYTLFFALAFAIMKIFIPREKAMTQVLCAIAFVAAAAY